MFFALAYGSFGDLLETAKLAVRVVKLLRDGARGKLSQERLALAVELQTLNSDLITLDFIASAFHLDTSGTRSLVVLRIRSEVESCRILLTQFLAKLKAPRSFLGTIIGALSEESELAEFRTKMSRPLKAIRTLMAMLNLSMSQGIGMEVERMGSQILQVLGSQVVQVGERFDHLGDRLAAYHEAVMNRPIPAQSSTIFSASLIPPGVIFPSPCVIAVCTPIWIV
ncbi:hypothetical protein B0H17DRAFT_1330503 [Mycena rosella]|uniref:Uncharacterized protein n=1 Tax=Mycena rosella TaxID=1033263 RepID=A0AAD7DJW7_MYCRO|nr:hypothetical protein B0H17DRAFT_1330503 [Mycena rosella]